MRKLVFLLLALNSTYYAQEVKKSFQLEDITIEAVKIKEVKSKIPLSVSLIKENTYLKEGVTSLYDTLANEVGVSVSGGEGRSQNITIRGISGNRIKIIKDGVSVSDGYGANNLNDIVGSNTFDLSNIKEIEILKGSSSAIQGSGSLGGVIIVKTKQLEDYLAEDDIYASSTFKYNGQSDKYQENIVLAKQLGKLQVGIRTNYATSEETKNYEDNVYKRDVNAKDITLMQAYDFDNLYWTNTFERYEENANRTEGVSPIQLDGIWEAKNFEEDKETITDEFLSKLEFDLNYDLAQKIDLKAYYRNTKNVQNRNILMYKENNNLLLKRLQMDEKTFENKIYGADLDVGTSFDSHDIKYGLSLKNTSHYRPTTKTIVENGTTTTTSSEPFAKAQTFESSAYVIDKYILNDFIISSALRYDYKEISSEESTLDVSDISSNNFSPSLSLTYSPTKSLNLYSSYNYGFKVPSADKIYANVPHLFGTFSDFILVPNLDLKEETSDNIELGIKYKNDSTYFHLALFHSWYDNFIEPRTISYDTTNMYAVKKYINIDSVKIYGFETSLTHQISKDLVLTASLGLVDGKDGDGEKLSNLTPLEGNLKVDYTYEKFDLFSRLNFASSMSRVPTCTDSLGIQQKCATSNTWASVDAGISYNYSKKMNFNFALFNLLDKRYIKYQDIKGLTVNQTKYEARSSRYFNFSFRMEF